MIKKKIIGIGGVGVAILVVLLPIGLNADLWSALQSGNSKTMWAEAQKLYTKAEKAKKEYDKRSERGGERFSDRKVDYTAPRAVFNQKKCSKVIRNTFPDTGRDLTICYDFKLKSATAISYVITKEMVEAPSLDDRLRFTYDEKVPTRFRTYYKDYSRSGYDRGHIANDASFDYSIKDLEVTYKMSNIVPQDPTVNRKIWIKAEKYERYIAIKLGHITVLNNIIFPENPNRLKSGIAIPSGFTKIIENKSKDFKRCFYFANHFRGSVKQDKLRDHEVNCNTL